MLRRRLFLSVMSLFSLLVGGLITALAFPHLQDGVELSKTYTSADGSLTFRYPAEWSVEALGDGRVVLGNEAPEIRFESKTALRIEISPAIPVSELSMMGYGTTPQEMVRASIALSNASSAFMAGMANATLTPSSGTPSTVATATQDISVVNFEVNGRPAAWGTTSSVVAGSEFAMMMIYIEVDDAHVVTLTASPWLYGGAELLSRYQSTVLAIADTVRYSPLATPTTSSGDLPKTFTGVVGGWQMGEITFNYPDDWYVLSFGPVLQTTNTPLNQRDLKPGQMQAAIVDPASNMALIKDWKDVVDCKANPEGVTALAVVQKQLPSTQKQREQYAAAGITFSEPERTSINGKDVVLLRLHQPQQDVLLIDIDLGNGNIAGLLAFAPEGEMAQYETRLLAIVGTFSYKPKEGCNPPTARPAEILTATASHITPSPSPTVFLATAVPNEKIAFVTANDQAGWQIYLMDTNGKNIHQLSTLKGLYSDVLWSPDGSHIAFIVFPQTAFLSLSAYVMKADGSDVQLLTDSTEGGLTWSPDGRQLAFISKQGGNRQLYTVAVDGTHLQQLTSGQDEVYNVDWSPDGTQLAFNKSDYGIYLINADGTGEHALTSSGSDEMPTWSPDGKTIAFSSRRGRNSRSDEVYIMQADGSQVRPLTNNLTIPTQSTTATEPAGRSYSLNGIVWSRDGRHIAFFTKTEGVIDAFVIDPDGSNLHHIASRVSGGMSWSPDSRHVVYSAGEVGKAQIFIADADGANKYPIVSEDPLVMSPMWSPSGLP